MAKRHIKSAFRLLPVYPGDFYLLGIKVGKQYYFDKYMPMGLNVSCALWEKVSTFLHWRVANITGLDTLDHLLDDSIFAGNSLSVDCQVLIKCFEETFQDLGIPIAEECSNCSGVSWS